MTPEHFILDPLTPAASLAFHDFWQAVMRNAQFQGANAVMIRLADLQELSRSAFGTGYYTGLQHAAGGKVKTVLEAV